MNQILRHQRAELGRAEVFRGLSVGLQLLTAVVAAISVFFSDGNTLVVLAGIGVVVLSIWLWTNWTYRSHRGAGEQARRLLQVIYGLGQPVSEFSHICEGFGAPTDKLKGCDIESYFATTTAPGMRRLAEMLDESAFFTLATQRQSARVMWFILFTSVIGAFVGWLFFGAQLEDNTRTAAVRVFMALTVFVLSSDVVGAAIAHGHAGLTMEKIRLRISAARGRGFQEGDTLQAMADYNAAVEGAPLPVPLVFTAMREDLTRRWAEHKASAGIGA